MKNKIIVAIVVIFALFVGTTSVFAKRLAPTPVEDLVFNGIKYSVSNVEMGYVEARDVQNNILIWRKQIYKVTYDVNLEKDVQDVYITNLQIEDINLLVTNEKGVVYKVDLKTGNGINDDGNISEGKQSKPVLFISVGLVVFLICTVGVFFLKRKKFR
jgi:hypothetical protein